MRNLRSDQELKNGFKELTGMNAESCLKSFQTFCKCVRWADNHPTKSLQSWMDEVTLLNKELQKYKNE